MKNQLLVATLGVGFLAGLGIAAVRRDLSQPAAVSPQAVAVRPQTPAPATDAAQPHPTAAPEPAASDPERDSGASADSLPAPTYQQEIAARDRAAAHSIRSR